MHTTPPSPQHKARTISGDGPLLITLLVILAGIVIGSIFFVGSNTRTEVVSTGRGMDIVHGHLERIRGTRGHAGRFVVISDEGREAGRFDHAAQGFEVEKFFDGINYCIYLQDHLLRTTYREKQADYRQYTSFEGIRAFNADGTCPKFPVD